MRYFFERVLFIPVELKWPPSSVSRPDHRRAHPLRGDQPVGRDGRQPGRPPPGERGATALGVVNVVGSSIAREADSVLYTWAGPEICVASTKAYTSQLVALYLLGLHAARLRGSFGAEETAALVAQMRQLPDLVSRVLDCDEAVRRMAPSFAGAADFFVLGRGLDYAVSLEGALKMKEISYIHGEALAAGEMKHGPLALVSQGTPVVCLVTQEALREKMLSNIKE